MVICLMTGTLNPANTYTVKSLVDGKVLTGTIEEGNIVEESNVLYTIDSSDASTNFEKAEIAMQQAQRSYDKVVDRQYVRAEVAGVVSSLKVTKGDEVTSGARSEATADVHHPSRQERKREAKQHDFERQQ